METKMVSELQRNNKVTIQAHLISVLVVAIFFFLQVTRVFDTSFSPLYIVTTVFKPFEAYFFVKFYVFICTCLHLCVIIHK